MFSSSRALYSRCGRTGFVAALSLALASGQTPFSLPPYNPPKIYVPTKFNRYVSRAGLWRTDETYQSTIRLSNQLDIGGIEATVTLIMADGTPYILAPVRLGRSGVATVNINDVLSQARGDIRSHISAFGSASVEYKYDWQGVVYASMSILDPVRSLEYTSAFMFPMEAVMGAGGISGHAGRTVLEGLTWGYSADSSVFIAFSNTTAASIRASLALSSGSGQGNITREVEIGPKGSVLLTDLPVSTAGGGLQVAYEGGSDDLLVTAGIEDAAHGFSANVPISDGSTASKAAHPVSTNTYASPGIMVGSQDPMMGFPASLRFEPYALVRNIGDQPIRVSAAILPEAGSKAPRLSIPDVVIGPHLTVSLPVKEAVKGMSVNGAITLTLSVTAAPGSFLIATGSTDLTGNYVFAVVPGSTGRSASKSSVYWTTANESDTMYSVFNPESAAQDVIARIQFRNGGTFEKKIHVEPFSTSMIDLRQMSEMGEVDARGSTLPASVTEGKLVLLAGSGDDRDAINVVLSGGIYNPRRGTCGNTCETCNGCASFYLNPNPFYTSVGANGQMYAQCTWYTGAINDYTGSSTWSSQNTSVLSVQSTPYAGLASGMGPGLTTAAAQMPLLQTNAGQICNGGGTLPPCPTSRPAPTSPANVCKVVVNSASIASDQISTTLSPSSLTGAFSLWESRSGSPDNQPLTNVSRTGATYTDHFGITTSTPTGQYGTIYASWNACSSSVVTSYNYRFYNYGNTHQSQYTLINESTCSGTKVKAYIITSLGSCFSSGLQTTQLESDFESQVALNGSGIEASGTYVKALAATSCAGATTGKPADANNGNTFVVVSSVTGSCNQALSSATVAQYSHQCGARILIWGYGGTPGTVKTVEDECPRCGSDPPHFDNWTSAGGTACGASITDLPGGYYVTEQVQQ